ncbi:MFS transporter [Alteromonas sp. 345S023]|uniref:MFS transporter n=1 Tax=Alteromonas profundi TaxID=2696062 RepID=A0A7X5LNJ1_9ALTE|nr:MFS transporter [Alteromonas profundi]NDV92662.1 MFS transporter [Alteromonas profundi]
MNKTHQPRATSLNILFCALLATSIGQSVMLTTLPSMGREAGLSEFHIAIIMSSSAFIFAIGTSFWSRVAKHKGYRKLLMVGLAGYSIGTFAFAGMWSLGYAGVLCGSALFFALLITRSLQSTIMSASPPCAVGYAIRISSDQQRVGAISRVTSANNVGQLFGPVYAGALVSFGLVTPLYSVVVFTLLAFVLVWRKLPTIQTSPSLQSQTNQPTLAKPAKGITLILVLSCASIFCAMAMMQQTLGFFFIDHYGKSPVQSAQQVGIAMMLSAATSLSIQILVVQKARFSADNLIRIALPLLCVAYLLMFIHQHIYTLYIAMLLMGLGMGMGYPSLAAVATSYCAPENQAKVTGYITATPAMGYILGPPLAAALYQGDIHAPFLAASVLLAVFTMIVFFLVRAKNK